MWVIRRHDRGEVYVGQVDDNGLKSGIGFQIYEESYGYFGQWKEGLFDGLGVLVCASDHYYIGMFERGTRKGLGKLRLPGSEYLGEFRAKKNGFGEVFSSNGTYAIGEFRDDTLHGNATIYDPIVGYKLSGFFDFGVASGLFTEISSGYEYCGYLVAGVRKGKGKLVSLTSSKIVMGEFMNGNPTGEVRMVADGYAYYGHMVNMMKDGAGRENGDTWEYVGEFKKDQREGLGVFRDTEEEYVGNWKGGKRHGLGAQSLKKKNFKEKVFYFGYWKEDRRHGQGYEKVGSREYRGTFKDGVAEGISMIHIDGEQPAYGVFRNGKITGFTTLEEYNRQTGLKSLPSLKEFNQRSNIHFDTISIHPQEQEINEHFRELDRSWTGTFDSRELEIREFYFSKIVPNVKDYLTTLKRAASSSGFSSQFAEVFSSITFERLLPERLIQALGERAIREDGGVSHSMITPGKEMSADWSVADQNMELANFVEILDQSVLTSLNNLQGNQEESSRINEMIEFSQFRNEADSFKNQCETLFKQFLNKKKGGKKREVYSPPPKTVSQTKFDVMRLDDVFPKKANDFGVQFSTIKCYEFPEKYFLKPNEEVVMEENQFEPFQNDDISSIEQRIKDLLGYEKGGMISNTRKEGSYKNIIDLPEDLVIKETTNEDSILNGELPVIFEEPSEQVGPTAVYEFETISNFSTKNKSLNSSNNESPATPELQKPAALLKLESNLKAYIDIIDKIEITNNLQTGDNVGEGGTNATLNEQRRKEINDEIIDLHRELEKLAEESFANDYHPPFNQKTLKQVSSPKPISEEVSSSFRMVANEIQFFEDESFS